MRLCFRLLLALRPLASLASLQCIGGPDACPLVPDCHALVARIPLTPQPSDDPGALRPASKLIPLSSPFLPNTTFLHRTCRISISYSIAPRDRPTDTLLRTDFDWDDALSLHETTVLQIWSAMREVAQSIVEECVENQRPGLAYGPLPVPGLEGAYYAVVVALAPERGWEGIPRAMAAMRALQIGSGQAPFSDMFSLSAYIL